MKKLLIAILVLLMITSSAYAFNFGQPASKVKVWQNVNATGVFTTTTVSTTVIKPGSKILGLLIVANGTGGSDMIGIWDTVDNGTGGSIAESIAEVEILSGGNSAVWFTYPLIVTTSVTIRQGGNTIIFIYYE